jgi:hypothetical protein
MVNTISTYAARFIIVSQQYPNKANMQGHDEPYTFNSVEATTKRLENQSDQE